MSAELWAVENTKPRNWHSVRDVGGYRDRRDFLAQEMRPLLRTVVNGQAFSTNRWGMRDRDYELPKQPGTYRIALLGPSHVLGLGVADGETFDAYLEEMLNSDAGSANAHRFEVLNFGMPAHSLFEQMAMLELRAIAFDPDVVIVTAPAGVKGPLLWHYHTVLRRRLPIPYDGIQAVVQKAGVGDLGVQGIPLPFAELRSIARGAGVPARMPWAEARRLLDPYAEETVAWTLGHIATLARTNDAIPVLLVLTNVVETPAVDVPIQRLAERAGFVVVDLLDVFAGRDLSALRVASWDDHPNASANRIIAERIFDELRPVVMSLAARAAAASGEADN
jgi:hypothetical protein